MLAALRTKPFRGDQVAAGAVVLTVLVALLNVRFADDWSGGAHLLYSAAAALFVLGLAASTPHEPGGPSAWHSALYVTGFLLAVAALIRLADVLGSDGGAGTVTWVAAALTVLGTWMARDRGSASGTLLAALSAVVTSLAALSWVFSPDQLRDYRYLLLVDILVLTLAALWQRVRAPAQGVQLLNAVGLVLVLIGLTFAVEAVGGIVSGALFGRLLGSAGPADYDGVPWGWATLTLAGGIGILSAGAADGERGNVVVAIVVLIVFVAMASGGDLLGWPLVLAGAAGALLVVGLRPSTPLPAEPPEGAGSHAPPSPPPPSIRPVG